MFTQADVTRALRGAQKAGLTVYRYWVEGNGRIVVVTSPEATAEPAPGRRDIVL